MVIIDYIDKDPFFYQDLKTWLPEYCYLNKINAIEINELTYSFQNTEIILINPAYIENKVDILQSLLQNINNLPVIFLTDNIYLPFVVSMIKNGAYNFFHKKKDKSILVECIKNILYKTLIPETINKTPL